MVPVTGLFKIWIGREKANAFLTPPVVTAITGVRKRVMPPVLTRLGHCPDTYSMMRSWPTGTEYVLVGKAPPKPKATGVPLSACALATARACGLPTLTVVGGTVGFVTVTGSGVLTTFTLRPPGGARIDLRHSLTADEEHARGGESTCDNANVEHNISPKVVDRKTPQVVADGVPAGKMIS
jgi:hypothetical protein